MRIAVCGLGKVGKPISDVLGRWHEVVGYDTDRSKCETTVSEAVEKSDAAIFVVQTPSLFDGSFSNVFLLRALESFSREAGRQNKKYLYVITSTTVPGSCEEFRQIIGDDIVYNPLFIRLDEVYEDLLKPSFLLVGATDFPSIQKWLPIWEPVLQMNATAHKKFVTVETMSLTEAELAKITLNCALTMKISLANQLHLVASQMGCDSKKIMSVVGKDPRIGSAYLEPGRPYGGPCLPRDNRMFEFVARRVKVRAAMSLAADEINSLMEQRQDVPSPGARALP